MQAREMGCVLASCCHHAVGGGDDDDVDEVILPWPEDVNASQGYPPLIMSEPAMVYMLAEPDPVAVTWPPFTPALNCHILVRALPFTL